MSVPSQHSAAEVEKFAHLLDEARQIKGVSLGLDAWRRLRRNRVATISLGFLILLALLALFTPALPLQSPRRVEMSGQFQAPAMWPLGNRNAEWLDDEGQIVEKKLDQCFGNLNRFNRSLVRLRAVVFGRWQLNSFCGTDELGRDILARLFWGARISLIVGLVATMVSLVIGVSYGATSGYLGGWVDEIMMQIVDILYSIPFIFVVIFLITFLSEPDIKAWLESRGIDRITIFFFVVGAIYWLTMARVVRGQVKSLKHDQFVEAARVIGANRPRIIFLHLVPNLLSIIIVYLTLTIPRVILFESALSFLGLGVEPPDVSWGLLANEGFKSLTPVWMGWWLVVFPGLALASTLFALNFLGDGLRDALDPRLKNK